MDFFSDQLSTNPTLQSILSNLTSIPLPFPPLPTSISLSHIRTTYINPYVIQPLSVLLTSSTPDLVSILLLVAILLISLKILDYARRIIMFWVWFVVKSVLWTAVIVFAWGVWRVGWEGVLKEVGWAWGLIGGFLDEGTGSGRNGAAGAAGGSAPDWGRRYNYRPGY